MYKYKEKTFAKREELKGNQKIVDLKYMSHKLNLEEHDFKNSLAI